MEISAVLDIFRLGQSTYSVSLIPSEGGRQCARYCMGETTLTQLLHDLYIPPRVIAETLGALRQTARHCVPNVRLPPERIKALGFLS